MQRGDYEGAVAEAERVLAGEPLAAERDHALLNLITLLYQRRKQRGRPLACHVPRKGRRPTPTLDSLLRLLGSLSRLVV